MSWAYYVVIAALAIGLGYLGGHVALLRGRQRVAPAEGEHEHEVTFAIEHLDGQTWALTNTGTASARVVTVVPLADGVEHWPPQPPPGSLTTATSERLPTLAPRASMSVWLSHHDRGQQVLVAWTSESNVRMGPIALDVPEPRDGGM